MSPAHPPKSRITSAPAFAHTPESLKYVVSHVCLPERPPDADDYTQENNNSLARAVCAAAHAYATHVCGTSEAAQWRHITKMLDNLEDSVQSECMDADGIVSQLREMQTSDILAFFIRRHNAGIILTRQQNFTLFQAFEVSPSGDAVRKAVAPLIRSYPGSAIEVLNEVVDGGGFQYEFANSVSHLNAVDLALLTHPQYIGLLLNHVLQTIGRATDCFRETRHVALLKHVRDHAGRSSMIGPVKENLWRRSVLWLFIRVAIQISVDGSAGSASYKRFLLFFICILASDGKTANLSNDLLHLMSSRIFRRLGKLSSSAPEWLSDMALKTSIRLRDILSVRWKPETVRRSPFLNPSQEELIRDTQPSLLHSREYIQNALKNPRHVSARAPFDPTHRRRGTLEEFLSLNGSFYDEAHAADPENIIYDVERSVEEGIDDWLAHVTNVEEACAQLDILMNNYLTRNHDPKDFVSVEDKCIMLLMAIELYVALDKLVVREFPVLADYPPGISIAFLEKLHLRKATSLHRLARAYQYLAARRSQSRPGWSIFSDEFSEESYQVRLYNQSPHLQQLKARIEGDAMTKTTEQPTDGAKVSPSPLPTSLLHAKVIVFELQCPPCVQIWRSAIPRILHRFYDTFSHDPFTTLGTEKILLENTPAFQQFFSKSQASPSPVQIHLACFHSDSRSEDSLTVCYVVQYPNRQDDGKCLIRQASEACRHWEVSFEPKYESYPPLGDYYPRTSHTSNDVLAIQANCPSGLSIDEFIGFAHLRSGGSLQWLNILRALRCKTLNLRRKEVHSLLAHAAYQVGPLDLVTGVWIWHQELQDPSFCNALLNELEDFLLDIAASSIDGVLMNTISLLLTRVLASTPHEDILNRVIKLLWSIRRKTFNWVQDLTYNLEKEPMNEDRGILLLQMAATCRSTFDVDLITLPGLLCVAEDVDALLSCTFFIHAILFTQGVDINYSAMLCKRDHRLCANLDKLLVDIILSDPSNYGIDLAVGRIFPSYYPSIQQWEQIQHSDTCWLTCKTGMTLNQPSKTVHINLLDGIPVVDGQSLHELLWKVSRSKSFQAIFRDQGFFVISSNLPGMDFTTLECKVHFSLQDDNVVIQTQGSQSNETLQLIPWKKLCDDLPPVLIKGHVHWLNLSTSIIEIRPLKELWKESSEHWRIDCTVEQYRIYKGYDNLVDIQSHTWDMCYNCFQCLNIVDTFKQDTQWLSEEEVFEVQSLSRDIMVTATTSVQSVTTLQLSIFLPRYGLSFFVNESGELESSDFKNMVYDEDQCIGTLFGLENHLVLRQKAFFSGSFAPPEALIHRCVLVPNGLPMLHDDHRVRVEVGDMTPSPRNNTTLPFYTYDVDTELGCLIGNGSLTSTGFLAYLHAATSRSQPDPLTGTTGTDAALCLLQSGRCRSVAELEAFGEADSEYWISTPYPQVNAAYKEIRSRYYWNPQSYRTHKDSVQEKHIGPCSPAEEHEITSWTTRRSLKLRLSALPYNFWALGYICNAGSSTEVILNHLICNRPAPELPTRSILHRRDTPQTSSDETHTLDQLLSVVRVDPSSSFQQEYIAYLGASAHHIRAESRVTHKVAGENIIGELKKYYTQCKGHYLQSMDVLKESLGPTRDPHEQELINLGHWPPITADALLRYLASTSPTPIPLCWKKCLTRLALLLLDIQRARRLLRFALDGLEDEFSKELENEGCDGWSPEEYPDWLLIQIQGNFLIRRTQVETAMEIMFPKSGENTVMQVNMGEGKSSVIIPIAAAALADGKQLVRVIVPKALTIQMFEVLVTRLGGLTNRPIYYLPFSRTAEDNGTRRSITIDDLQNLMSQCIAERGILLVQPEHVMSLKLKGVEEQMHESKLTIDSLMKPQKSSLIHITTTTYLESGHGNVNQFFRPWMKSPNRESDVETNRAGPQDVHTGDPQRVSDSASKWIYLQKWLHVHARDILDESDEILHARFQMVYTIGPQRHIDGYPDRWTITQQVLGLVKKHVSSLSRYAPNSVDCELGPPGSFPRVHILQTSDIGTRLRSLIVEDVMAGELPNFNFQHLSATLRDALRSFIFHESVLQVPATVKKVEEYAKGSDQSHLWNGLLILRGLLASNILVFSLGERRWRVDYGLVSRQWSTTTKLAVPYRAKDLPAPNTQFGHPDLTIILTCLSYYYGGLSEDQLRECFETLLDQDNPTTEYALWIKICDSAPNSLRKLNNINLRSSEQWDNVVFPLFTRNQAAIDFYLSRVVFPKEAKEFPWKLSGSSWDLAEKREKPITGFSGTNDGRWLLPTSIVQLDLNHQKGACARVLADLLRQENDAYVVTHDSDSGTRWSTHAFLRMLAAQQPEIRVLLDVGSQILDLCNDQVAAEWLQISHNAAGVVYFKDDELMVLARNGVIIPLLSSPLAQQLERCVVYLDHAHTRGTDIKLPIGSRAAVTLGPMLTKDALVQGCMRMRKLGRGHSVMFFAPLEVDRSIRVVTAKADPNVRITTADILCWAIHETWSDIQRRAPYWAQQGTSHKSRYEAWTQFASGRLTRQELANAWVQPDLKSLEDLYAPCKTNNTSSSLLELDPDILPRCKALGVVSLPKARMDEVQEREVCRQREREREVELPPMAEPAEHFLHPDVVSFVKTGILPLVLHSGGAFLPVFSMLEKSSSATRDADVWSSRIMATADFCRTIKPESTQGTKDQYLRHVQWILSSKIDREILVVLSPFEADCLMPDIRASEYVHLHVYAPRTSKRMKPSDDLKLFSIPSLPSDWTPPWTLMDQLNVFAGQLYLRDYESYLRLCRFLGVPTKESSDGAIPRNLFSIPGSFEEMEIMFSGSPLPFVRALLAIRTRGRPFADTHMGKILQGQLLTRKDFEGTIAASSPIIASHQMTHQTTWNGTHINHLNEDPRRLGSLKETMQSLHESGPVWIDNDN